MRQTDLAKVGIHDESFELHSVTGLVGKGVLERPIDGNHGEIHPKGEDFVATGVPFLMASDINNGGVDYSLCKFITVRQADGLRKGFAKNGDVLLTHKATIGRTAIVQYHEHPYVMLTPQVTYYRVRNKQRLSNRYLRYYFESSFFQSLLGQWAGAGATRAYLGITEQGKLPVVMPPYKKQKKISAVLSAYDDLIENNRRRIALLERMAEQLYREWFVRFRFPGYQQAKFEKGIPVGWHVVELSEVAHVNGNSIKKGREPESIRYLDIGAVTTNAIEIPEPIRYRDAPGRARRCLRHGDVIWSSVRPANRAYRLVLEPPDNLIASTGFAVISHRHGMPFSFIKFVVTTDAFVEQMTAVAKGAAYPATSFDDFASAKLLLPPPGLLAEFDRMALPMLTMAHRLGSQNKALRDARDLLLPRLISGKLRVDDLDIQFPPSMQAERA